MVREDSATVLAGNSARLRHSVDRSVFFKR
jgi:hypothetical protein